MATERSTHPFADLLRRARLAAGHSQEALAERAGLSARGISDLERGVNHTPQRETVLRLADALVLDGEARAAFEAVAQRRIGSHPAGLHSHRLPATLPVPLTPLLGRESEVRALIALLRRDAVRLVTLSGPGGVGKTRLAVAVAAELADTFPDGVIFVPLADLRDAQTALASLAQHAGLRTEGSRPLIEDLATHLQARRLLLVVDNFEHLLPAAPALATLLEACPRLKMLVTSRAALRLRGEHEVPVEPLALPDLQRLPPPDVLARSPAVALFLERMGEHRPDFALNALNAATVAAVCARLEGLPLALELAAAQGRLFTPRALLARLDRRLAVLTGGPRDLPARQRTMATTIAWSYDLLPREERTLFRRLAVFAGGCTLEAVAAVCQVRDGREDDLLGWLRSLLDNSLLRQTEMAGGEARFAMLETIREYGLQQLASVGELGAVRQAHAQHYVTVTAEAGPALRGAEQGSWLTMLDAEHDNLRSALDWTLREAGDRTMGLRLAGNLGYFWAMRGHYREGHGWLREALASLPSADPGLRATALTSAGNLAHWLGELAQAQADYEEALALWRINGDTLRIARGLLNVGNMAMEQEDYDQARAFYEEALTFEAATADRQTHARLLNNLGVLALAQGDPTQAQALYEECAALWREVGDQYSLANQVANIGEVAALLGDVERAGDCFRQSLAMRRDLNDRDGVRWTLHSMAFLARQGGDAARAARLLGAASPLTEQLGAVFSPQRQALYDGHMAALRERLGDTAFAAAWAEGRGMEYARAIAYALGR